MAEPDVSRWRAGAGYDRPVETACYDGLADGHDALVELRAPSCSAAVDALRRPLGPGGARGVDPGCPETVALRLREP
jgi:hypothetical protein